MKVTVDYDVMHQPDTGLMHDIQKKIVNFAFLTYLESPYEKQFIK